MADMNIRLHGTEDECMHAAARLLTVFDVLSISGPCADRGASRLVRVYAEIGPVTSGSGTGPARRPDERVGTAIRTTTTTTTADLELRPLSGGADD
jgi:hypothetical protein